MSEKDIPDNLDRAIAMLKRQRYFEVAEFLEEEYTQEND